MKKYFHIVITILLNIIWQGCSNDEISIDNNIPKVQKDNLKTRSWSECLGHGECLPIVDVQHLGEYSSTPGTMISWSSSENGCNIFILTCKGINQNTSQYVQSSGSLFFLIL